VSWVRLGFERPELLVLAPVSAIILALAVGAQWRRLGRLVQDLSTSSYGRLLPVQPGRRPNARLLSLTVAGLAVGFAAAGPTWLTIEPEAQPPVDVALAVDLSLSMSATDAAPSRIGRAREVITRLSGDLPSIRFSLVAFAGWPYTVLPPTDDHLVLDYFARSLDVGLVPPAGRGTSLAEALEHARYTLEARPSEGAIQVVLLLSDGGGEEAALVTDAAAGLADAGFQLWVGALGSAAETPLVLDGVPLLDGAGRQVLSSLNEALLREAAEAGRGSFVNVTSEDGLESLVASLRELSGDREGPPPRPVDAAFFLVLLAIPLFLWESVADLGRSRASRAGRSIS